MAATHELYRRSKIGEALTETLDEMITNNLIDAKLAMLVVRQFDATIAEALNSKVKSKLTLKGHLNTYRFCDDVWTLLVDDPTLRFDQAEVVTAEKVKIVAMTAIKKENAPE
ncbi:transcription initiation factor IIA, gamma subunit-domain-containing protein [Hyaloraphidium curvatum]|nr:transcription initiation factor IIA, gamma subunit-domain-containing protein [Hyaloraphidium curvatum]